jgi:hypothetical protein
MNRPHHVDRDPVYFPIRSFGDDVEVGDIVRIKGSNTPFVVTLHEGDCLVVTCTRTATNPPEWEIYKPRKEP